MKKFFQKLSNKNKNLINRLDSYFFKNKTRKIIFLSISIVVFSGALFVVSVASAGALTFFQSGWTGGLTSNTTNSQTGWNQYSAGTNITAGTNVTLTPNNSTDTQNTFTSYTYQSGQGVYLSGGLSMKKPLAASCSADAQCTSGWCGNGTCKTCTANQWGGIASGGSCWYRGSSKYQDSVHPDDGATCTTICAYNGLTCNPANWDDPTCTIMGAVWPGHGSGCGAGVAGEFGTPEWDWAGSPKAPRYYGYTQSCSALPFTNERARLCACY